VDAARRSPHLQGDYITFFFFFFEKIHVTFTVGENGTAMLPVTHVTFMLGWGVGLEETLRPCMEVRSSRKMFLYFSYFWNLIYIINI
jgi:hypothetical protein